jgi:uncharacterized membrane protein
MPELIPLFLYLHIVGAIIAFGPTFMLPYLAVRASREPQHANFMARSSLAVSKGIIVPVALSTAVTGGLLMWSGGIDVMAAGYLWLQVAIVLYVIALGISFLVMTPNAKRLIELTSSPPPPGPTGGPPPEVAARARRARIGSFVLMTLVLVIVYLMVVKPLS